MYEKIIREISLTKPCLWTNWMTVILAAVSSLVDRKLYNSVNRCRFWARYRDHRHHTTTLINLKNEKYRHTNSCSAFSIRACKLRGFSLRFDYSSGSLARYIGPHYHRVFDARSAGLAPRVARSAGFSLVKTWNYMAQGILVWINNTPLGTNVFQCKGCFFQTR